MSSQSYKNLNVRLTEQESDMVDEYQQILQQQYGDEIRVTQRTVIVQALKFFGDHLQSQLHSQAQNAERLTKELPKPQTPGS